MKVILGGIREVTAARLRRGQASELPGLADELAAWAESYPAKLPAGLDPASAAPHAIRDQAGAGKPRSEDGRATPMASERARQAEGRLPSGRHDLPRQFIVKNQRERIVDATAAIVAEKGLAGLTIPEIAQARERLAPDVLRDVPDQARRVPGRTEGRPAPGAG